MAMVVLAMTFIPWPVHARLGMTAAQLTRATFDPFIKKSEKVLVDFYDGEDNQRSEQMSELEAAVREVRGFGCRVPVAKVDARKEVELASKFVPDGRYPQLLWFTKGEATQYHKQLRTATHIATFMLALDRPAITTVKGEADVREYSQAVFAQIPRTSPMYGALEVVASRHMDQVAITFLESNANNITFIGNNQATVGYYKSDTYTGPAAVPELDLWVRRLLTKSEELPEEPLSDGSVVVVGQTFEDLVLRPDKDVFLMVYAPWCGFSKKFFPMWESFAEIAAKTPSLVVAKIDGDRNGPPPGLDAFSWHEYPTLLFVRAGQRSPHIFHGNRTIDNLVKFVDEHGSAPIQKDGAGDALGEL